MDASSNVYLIFTDAPLRPPHVWFKPRLPLTSINFIFCLLPYQVVHQSQAEVLAPVEMLGLDLVHLIVLKVGSHRARQSVGSESLEESYRVEGKACRPEGSGVGRHLVGKGEMACHDRQEEEGRLACQMVEEACL